MPLWIRHICRWASKNKTNKNKTNKYRKVDKINFKFKNSKVTKGLTGMTYISCIVHFFFLKQLLFRILSDV